MDVAYENETINEFFAKDDIPICFEQLERYLHEDAASMENVINMATLRPSSGIESQLLTSFSAGIISLTESSNSATCTPYNQSVASTPIVPSRQPHPTHSLSASTNAVNTLSPSGGRQTLGFDNPGFVTDVKNGYQEVSPRLPDSPPDSGSEAFSPENRDVGPIPAGYLPNNTPGHAMDHHGNVIGPIQGYPTASMEMGGSQQHPGIMSVSGGVPQGMTMGLPPQYIPTTMAPEGMQENFQRAPSFSTSHRHKKRKHSLTPESTVNQALLKTMGINIKQEQVDMTNPCANSGPGYSEQQGQPDQFDQLSSGDGMAYTNTVYQSLKWQPYQQQKWHKLYDSSYKELSQPTFRVEADKGFNFAVPDDAFVCQKKNHFQVTVHIGVTATPVYVRTDTGATAPVKSFKLYLRGIKVEAINSNIRVEQSQADRTKKEFTPVNVDLRANEITKATVGRLHFSETTSNNMRKKGKPNPDQRYFMLVVGIHAHTDSGHFPIASHVSERIIVRASNPGQFESDMDVMWQRGGMPDSVFHTGNVGIKTETPDEALTVHGNVRVTGHIVQPSDERAKEDFKVLDPKEQLRNIERMKIMQYKYKQAFAEYAGLPECDRVVETGVVAQELQEILPDAVYTTGDVELQTGENIDSFLVVNKDRIYMESVGAVKELCRLNNKLETRINEIEKVNRKLAKLKRLDSLKSTSSGTLSRNGSSRSQASVKSKGRKGQQWPQGSAYLSPRAMQCTMVLLIFIMFFCVVTMAVLLVLQFKTTESMPESTQAAGELKNLTNSSMTTPGTPPWSIAPPSTTSTSDCGYDSCEKYCCDTFTTPNPPVPPNNPERGQQGPTTSPTASALIPGGPLEPTSKEPFVPEFVPIDVPIELPKDPKMDKDTTMAYNETEETMPETEEGGMPPQDDPDDINVEGYPASARRRKRASGEDSPDKGGGAPVIESIWTSVLSKKGKDGNVTDTEYCKKPCGGEDGDNYTYEIPVSVYFKEEVAKLKVTTDKDTKSVLCTRRHSPQRCSSNATNDGDKAADSEVKQGPNHSWDLPIKYYVSNTFTIQWFPANTDNTDMVCKTDASQLEYTFVFFRDRGECMA